MDNIFDLLNSIDVAIVSPLTLEELTESVYKLTDEIRAQLNGMDNKNDMKYFLELMELERIFEFNGYNKKQIINIEGLFNAQTIEDFVNNLEEERSCWG